MLSALLLLLLLLIATQAAQGALTDHLLVQLHEDAQDEAHQLAAQHGFQSARKVGVVVVVEVQGGGSSPARCARLFLKDIKL